MKMLLKELFNQNLIIINNKFNNNFRSHIILTLLQSKQTNLNTLIPDFTQLIFFLWKNDYYFISYVDLFRI